MGKKSREKKEKREIDGLSGTGTENTVFSWPEKICLSVIRWATYLMMFVPLIVVKSSFFPFVAPKSTIFRVIVEIIFAAYLILVSINPRYRPKFNILTWAATLFLGIFILASFLGINPERSFWSTFERMTGVWTILHLYVLFIVLSNVFKERRDWKWVFCAAIAAGVLLSLYVLRGYEASSRGGGTIGNTSFMAAYLLFDVFFAIILFLTATDLGWRLYSGITFLIMLPVLLNSTGRGAIFSFWTGIFLMLMGYFWFSGIKILRKIFLGIVLLAVFFAGFSIAFQPPFETNKIQSLLLEMKPRFTVWKIALESFKDRPILGWGPENFNVAFNQHFNPCLFTLECGQEIWFDRSHNIILDTAATTGIIGLASYLFLYLVSVFGVLRILPKVIEKRNIFYPLGVAALLFAYFFQNLLVFDMINTLMMFFLSLAFVSFITFYQEEKEEIYSLKPLNRFWLILVIIFTISVFWVGNVKPLQSAFYTVRMLSVQNQADSSMFFKESLESLMEKYETREQFAQRVAGAVFGGGQQDKEALQQAFDLAEKEMEISCEKNSLDFRPYLFLGRLYNASYHFSGNQEKLVLAENILNKAIELSPNNQQGYWYLSETRLSQGKNDEAINLLKKAVELEPKYGRSYWFLAMGYKITGQFQLAKEAMSDAMKNGYNWETDVEEIKRVIEVYSALNDNAGMISLLQKATELDPKNTQIWATLAAAYANVGQIENAKGAARIVAQIDPSLATETEEFIRNLK